MQILQQFLKVLYFHHLNVAIISIYILIAYSTIFYCAYCIVSSIFLNKYFVTVFSYRLNFISVSFLRWTAPTKIQARSGNAIYIEGFCHFNSEYFSLATRLFVVKIRFSSHTGRYKFKEKKKNQHSKTIWNVCLI